MQGIVRALSLVALLGGMVVVPASVSARTRTAVTVFQPFTSTGVPTLHTRTKSGYCYTGSLAIDRRDAWRCFVGNFIYDPCFSSSRVHGIVVCPNIDIDGGVAIRLTKALPRRQADRGAPSRNHQPWNIELTSGNHCAFSSGASNVVHGVRLNYFCEHGGNNGLWGYPDRHTEPWTILIAPFTARTLHDRRAIRHAWM